jgi:RNA polymerase sigma-70 factor (ECF subfamily)
VAHDTFVRAFQSLHRYRPGASFSSWLTSIAIRASCDYWREQMRHRTRQMSPPPGEEARQWFEQLVQCRTADEADDLVRRRDAGEAVIWSLLI